MAFFVTRNFLRVSLAIVLTLSTCAFAFAATSDAPDFPNFGMVPKAGTALARQIDRQLSGGFGKSEGGGASGFSMIVTIPADLGNLEKTNPLSRQLAEEMARWFVQAGYNVHEVRMAANLFIDEEKGELMLSRKTKLLKDLNANVMGVLVGTYTVTRRSVRFNVRMVQANGNEVLGMSTITLPLDGEVRTLLTDEGATNGIAPAVGTRLALPDASMP